MRINTLRQPLWIAGAALLAGAAALAVLFLVHGWGKAPEPEWIGDDLASLTTAAAAAAPEPADDGPILRRMDRPVTKVTAAPGDGGWKAKATFCEPDPKACRALISGPANSQRLVGVGDAVDGFKVLRITPGGVTLGAGGRELLLKVAGATD